jgi:hypothetical protein
MNSQSTDRARGSVSLQCCLQLSEHHAASISCAKLPRGRGFSHGPEELAHDPAEDSQRQRNMQRHYMKVSADGLNRFRKDDSYICGNQPSRADAFPPQNDRDGRLNDRNKDKEQPGCAMQIDREIAAPKHLPRKYELQENDEKIEYDNGPIAFQERHVPSLISDELKKRDKVRVDSVTHFFSTKLILRCGVDILGTLFPARIVEKPSTVCC